MLYGQDMDETTNPFEVGLGWITKLDKGEFIGRDALTRLKATGVQRRMIFIMQERGIPRTHYQVMQDEQVIGDVTSGTMSPTLGQAIGTPWCGARLGKSAAPSLWRFGTKPCQLGWCLPLCPAPRQTLNRCAS